MKKHRTSISRSPAWFTVTNPRVDYAPYIGNTRFRHFPRHRGQDQDCAPTAVKVCRVVHIRLLTLRQSKHALLSSSSAKAKPHGRAPDWLVRRQMKAVKEQWMGLGLSFDLALCGSGDMELAAADWRTFEKMKRTCRHHSLGDPKAYKCHGGTWDVLNGYQYHHPNSTVFSMYSEWIYTSVVVRQAKNTRVWSAYGRLEWIQVIRRTHGALAVLRTRLTQQRQITDALSTSLAVKLNVTKIDLDKEELKDDGSGVHDFPPQEADKYVKYPEVLGPVGYVRMELEK